jgi:sulfide:quinone oxidoreductase
LANVIFRLQLLKIFANNNANRTILMRGSIVVEIKKLSENLSVAGQLIPADVANIAELGFKTIICNRPDGEASDQPEFDTIRHNAENAGLSVVFMPVLSSGPTQQNIGEFSAALDTAQSPVLAYCRTGTRCTILWALSQGAKGMPVDDIVSTAANAGYDVSKVAAYISQSQTS